MDSQNSISDLKAISKTLHNTLRERSLDLQIVKGINCIFFNPCIPAIVAKVAFSKGGLCIGVLAQYCHKFNPIPLPLIAYAGTLVWIVLLLSLLNFLMFSVQGTWRPARIHHWSLEQRSLYSWGCSPCV